MVQQNYTKMNDFCTKFKLNTVKMYTKHSVKFVGPEEGFVDDEEQLHDR